MDGSSPPSDALERVAEVPAKDSWWRSVRRRATATRARVAACAAAAVIISGAAVAGGIAGVTALSAPRPDTVLRATLQQADVQIVSLATEVEIEWEIDVSQLRAYEPYLGMEVWYTTNAFGSRCLIAVQRQADVVSDAKCVPPSGVLFVDVSSWGDDFTGLPREGVARIFYRGDSLEVFVYFVSGVE